MVSLVEGLSRSPAARALRTQQAVLGRDLGHRGAELLAGGSSQPSLPGPGCQPSLSHPHFRSTEVGGTLPSARPSTLRRFRAGGERGSGLPCRPWSPEQGCGIRGLWGESPPLKPAGTGDPPPGRPPRGCACRKQEGLFGRHMAPLPPAGSRTVSGRGFAGTEALPS